MLSNVFLIPERYGTGIHKGLESFDRLSIGGKWAINQLIVKGNHMDVRKYVVEFIGTFFLVLTIGCVVIGGEDAVGNVKPIAIGIQNAVGG